MDGADRTVSALSCSSIISLLSPSVSQMHHEACRFIHRMARVSCRASYRVRTNEVAINILLSCLGGASY